MYEYLILNVHFLIAILKSCMLCRIVRRPGTKVGHKEDETLRAQCAAAGFELTVVWSSHCRAHIVEITLDKDDKNIMNFMFSRAIPNLHVIQN